MAIRHKKILEHNEMLNFYLNLYENERLVIHKKLFQNLSDQFHQNAFESMKDEDSKLKTYAIFKTKIGIEGCLSENKNYKIRTQVTKLKLSNHTLQTETGQHKNIPPKIVRLSILSEVSG